MWAKNPYYWPEHAGASVAASCPSYPGTKIIFSLVLRHGNGRLLVVMGLTTTMRPFFLTCIDWINSCDLWRPTQKHMKQPHMVRLLTRTVYMFLQLQTWPFFDLWWCSSAGDVAWNSFGLAWTRRGLMKLVLCFNLLLELFLNLVLRRGNGRLLVVIRMTTTMRPCFFSYLRRLGQLIWFVKANPKAHEAAPHGEDFDEDCLHVSLLQLQMWPFLLPLVMFICRRCGMKFIRIGLNM